MDKLEIVVAIVPVVLIFALAVVFGRLNKKLKGWENRLEKPDERQQLVTLKATNYAFYIFVLAYIANAFLKRAGVCLVEDPLGEMAFAVFCLMIFIALYKIWKDADGNTGNLLNNFILLTAGVVELFSTAAFLSEGRAFKEIAPNVAMMVFLFGVPLNRLAKTLCEKRRAAED